MRVDFELPPLTLKNTRVMETIKLVKEKATVWNNIARMGSLTASVGKRDENVDNFQYMPCRKLVFQNSGTVQIRAHQPKHYSNAIVMESIKPPQRKKPLEVFSENSVKMKIREHTKFLTICQQNPSSSPKIAINRSTKR